MLKRRVGSMRVMLRMLLVTGLFTLGSAELAFADIFYAAIENKAVETAPPHPDDKVSLIVRIYSEQDDVRFQIVDPDSVSSGLTYKEFTNRVVDLKKLKGAAYQAAVRKQFPTFFTAFAISRSKWAKVVAANVDRYSAIDSGEFRELIDLLELPVTMIDTLRIGSKLYDTERLFEPAYVDRQTTWLRNLALASYHEKYAGSTSNELSHLRRQVASYQADLRSAGATNKIYEIEKELQNDLYWAWVDGRPEWRSAASWGHNISRRELEERALAKANAAMRANRALRELESVLQQIDQNQKAIESLDRHTKIFVSWCYATALAKVSFIGTLAAAISSSEPYTNAEVSQAYSLGFAKAQVDLPYDGGRIAPPAFHLVISKGLAGKIGYSFAPFMKSQSSVKPGQP